MFNAKKKVDLSPRLKLAVGRGYSQNQILKFSAVFFLTIALILSANAIRLLFSGKYIVSSAAGEGAGQVLGASDTKTDDGSMQFISYKITKGDTLFNISQKFNIDWNTLATLNNLKTPYLVKPGDTIKIPH